MEFFDCNVMIGKPTCASAGLTPEATVSQLLRDMDRAGIERALVWHIAQHDQYPVTGNEMLAAAIAGQSRLAGCWTLLPNQAGELGNLDEWFHRAVQSGVRALRAFPAPNRYLLRSEVIGDIVEHMRQRRMPLLLSPARGAPWPDIYSFLAEFSELTVIVYDVGVWGPDRYLRPLVERYPNVHFEISQYLVDGGIEAFVADYGPRQMLFGSGYPAAYMGAMLLALARAGISESDRQAIAGGNMRRLLEAVR